jgi:hypothetical protein
MNGLIRKIGCFGIFINLCLTYSCSKTSDYYESGITSIQYKHVLISKDTTIKIERVIYPISGSFILPNSKQEMLMSVSAYANTKAIIQTNKGNYSLEVEPITNVNPDEVMNMKVYYGGYKIIHHTFNSYEQTPLYRLKSSDWPDLLYVDTLNFQ